jgi:hypothetical protein
MAQKRNWKKEYAARAEYLISYRRAHKKEDAARHRARRKMNNIPAGHEVDHKDNNPNNNAKGNLRIVPRKQNRQKGARKTNSN